MGKTANPTSLEAVDLAAFVSLKQGITPRPTVRPSDQKVVFEFTQDVTPAVSAYYANEAAPIMDFCRYLKLLKSMIFSVKSARQ